ncbi:hypothetical protein DPMN_072059 [Dreissena polymorpha]|uniref:Uncharacterized protein n=1 Tax=Dreissena polymorpha TaxID=45954 RepID=A0A9D3Z5M2_DREPO|nr:hypothetical protein DPMN_072059 [Dreissena polymorpha]
MLSFFNIRLFTFFHYIHIEKTAPPPGGHENSPPTGGHVFLPIRTIFKLNRHIQKTHVLTKVHEHWTNNVTSRVFTCFQYIHIEKTAPPPGGHVFLPIWTIFELVRDINETNVLTKFHDDWAIIVTSRVFTRNTAPTPGGHIFQRTLHEDWALNVTSTVFTSFKLSRDINRTNVLNKFHDDRTINVASGVFTRQNVDDARRTKCDHKSVVLSHEHFSKPKRKSVTKEKTDRRTDSAITICPPSRA